jgi:hypothetical protein
MELKLKTPQQRWIYQNVWPHPGSRFGNEWTAQSRGNDLRWLNKTWAQATGLSPAAVPEGWNEVPDVREAAEKIEQQNRKSGMDEKISGVDFIDLQAAPSETESKPEPATTGVFGSLKRTESKSGKYIVITLAIIAVILILKMIL